MVKSKSVEILIEPEGNNIVIIGMFTVPRDSRDLSYICYDLSTAADCAIHSKE